jgi:hypothetical protein
METRAPYVTSITKADTTISDGDISEALRLFEAAGINPRRLLALAQACYRRKEHGFGRVVMMWVKKKPHLLLEEVPDLWEE